MARATIHLTGSLTDPIASVIRMPAIGAQRQKLTRASGIDRAGASHLLPRRLPTLTTALASLAFSLSTLRTDGVTLLEI
jgi:hypothetical protein